MSETPRGPAWSAAWGVVAVILGTGAFATWSLAVSPRFGFPAWPAWGLSAATAAALYMCFACLSGTWPAGRALGRSERVPLARQPQPSQIDLIPEQAGDWLRLGLLNRGPAAVYSAEVTGILDPLGRRVGQQHWPIPWLEDSSSEPKRILTGQTRMLDFAHYDMATVNAELSTGKGGGDHWRFSSVPTAINASYYNLRTRMDLEEQHFILTVRVMNANSGRYFDRQFTVGVNGSGLVCELTTSVPVTRSQRGTRRVHLRLDGPHRVSGGRVCRSWLPGPARARSASGRSWRRSARGSPTSGSP
jgi:hypothetical protein